ncbi:hypothetical protein BN135_2010 [Cronobacter muytjensii 530]
MAQVVGHATAGHVITQLDLIQSKPVNKLKERGNVQSWGDFAVNAEAVQCNGHLTLLKATE